MKFPAPPRGFKAIPWRLPIWIYRLGLGFLMGNRVLLLTHKGRITGEKRLAVLEIIHSNPELDQYFVVSGFGTRSHWYQNIKTSPEVTIQIGTKKISALANQLDPEKASQLILIYTQKHPKNLQILGSLLGYEIDHTPEGYLSFGREIPVIQFSPRDVETNI